MFDFLRRLRRADLLEAPFPEAWTVPLERGAPLVRKMRAEDRHKLERLVLIFLAEKNFEGAGGFELTDDVRVAIAARACLLVLRRVELDEALYPDLVSIVVYPGAYRAPSVRQEGHVIIEDEASRLGESWDRGVVVLSWKAVREGSAHPADGHDVVLHEFAHQLDAESGAVNGAPDLGRPERYATWARVMSREFERLQWLVEQGRATHLDAYAAESPPEFFAVLTEEFIERPAALRERYPEVYRELATFYGFDPTCLPA